MRAQREGGHRQARKRFPTRNPFCRTLTRDIQLPGLWENGFLSLKPPSLWSLAALISMYCWIGQKKQVVSFVAPREPSSYPSLVGTPQAHVQEGLAGPRRLSLPCGCEHLPTFNSLLRHRVSKFPRGLWGQVLRGPCLSMVAQVGATQLRQHPWAWSARVQ